MKPRTIARLKNCRAVERMCCSSLNSGPPLSVREEHQAGCHGSAGFGNWVEALLIVTFQYARRLAAGSGFDEATWKLNLFTAVMLPLIMFAPIQAKASQIIQWGDSTRAGSYPGPTNAPAGLTDAVAIAGGFYHSLALTAGGTVVAWGNNRFGQTNVPPDLSNVVACAAGAFHNLAVTDEGRVVGWGDDSYGQATVPPGLSNVVQVSAGEYHSVALRADGSVVAWGNFFNGVTLDPNEVPPGLSNCITIASGASHALGITSDGHVLAWGGRATNVPPDLEHVVGVTAGRDQSIALTRAGRIVVWGLNNPAVFNLAQEWTNVLAIAMERLWAVALLADGKVVAGGDVPLDYGQTNLPSGLSNVVMIAAGRYHGLALIDSGSSEYSWRLPHPHSAATNLVLDVPTERGRLYVVESSDSLHSVSWTIEQRIAGDGAVRRLFIAPQNSGFYRARRVP